MRKLWNRNPLAMWSLSTINKHGETNMNICGYVTNISMEPRMMLVSMYHHTLTADNVKETKRGLLQLLTTEHVDIVHTLGKQSGRQIDKIEKTNKKHPVKYFKGLPFMTDTAGYMELKFVDFLEVGGDHVLGIAKVTSSKNFSDKPILTTDYLKEKGILRTN